jgi:DNA helicase-2/ATP-dependent DNA helicase PcrA
MTELILGPPGTGKTTTLLKCVEEELGRGTRPSKIAYVSFTKRAAAEAVERACRKFDLTSEDLPYFRTLHSLCFRAICMSRSGVFEGEKIQEWANYIGVRVTGRWNDDGTYTGFADGDRIVMIENLARVRRVSLREQFNDTADAHLGWTFTEHACASLKKFKEEHALKDYTDMLEDFLECNVEIPLDVLVVDEAQDLSALQWKVVEKLAAHARRVIIAGDDDQAIYAWAGADVEHLVNLTADVRVLDQSWRVPKAVQLVANELVDLISQRRPKAWYPRLGTEGAVERVIEFGDVDLSGDDVMILVRNDFVSRAVEDYLRNQAIFYEKKGQLSIRKSYLSAIVAWEKLRKGEFVPIHDIKSVYECMSSRVGVAHGFKKTLNAYDDEMLMGMQNLKDHAGLLVDTIWHDALDRIPLSEREYILGCRRNNEKFNARPRVRLSTIHSAKGAEAKHVVLMLEVARLTDKESVRKPDDELRVWYVAVTRAKERLTLVEPQLRNSLRCRWL